MSARFGYLLPTRENIMGGDPSTRGLIEAGQRAADYGFDSLWVGDSLLARPRHARGLPAARVVQDPQQTGGRGDRTEIEPTRTPGRAASMH